MQRSKTIVALFAATLIVGGCQKADSKAARMQYPGLGQLSKARSSPMPETEAPKILPKTHFAAGLLFEEQGNVGKAITQYRKAVALNHSYVAAYHRLGRMYSLAGKHDLAIQAVARATEIKPDNAILHNDLSFEYMFAGRWDDAERSLRRAIELRPTMARAHINLALVLSKQGRFDDALATFRLVLPEADAYYNLGLLYRGNRQYAKAVDAFRRVLDISGDFSVAQTQLDEVTANLLALELEKAETVDSQFAEAHEISAPRILKEDSANTERRELRVAAITPTPTRTRTEAAVQTVTPKFTVRDDSPDILAKVVRSILSGSADVIRNGEASDPEVQMAGRILPRIDELDVQGDCDRELLIETINAAIETHIASSKRPVSAVSDEDVLTIGGDVECDELENEMPTVARRSLLADELERLSFNMEEEFFEIEDAKTAPVVVAKVEPYGDFLTDEEFIEPTPTKLVDSTKLMTPPVEITRHTTGTPNLRYEDFLTDEESIETEAVLIPLPRAPMKDRLAEVTPKRPTAMEKKRVADASPKSADQLKNSTNAVPRVEDVEMSAPRIEWNQELVTLDELIDIMDNERRCFDETDFAGTAPEWPIVDALAYSPVLFDAPMSTQTPDPWADFARLQRELDRRAMKVTEMVGEQGSQRTETKLAALEKSVKAMERQVAERKTTAKRMTEDRRSREAKVAEAAKANMAQKRRERLAMGKSMQEAEAARTRPSKPTQKNSKTADREVAPTVLGGSYGPPALAMADRQLEKTEFSASEKSRARRTKPARRTRVVHRGVELNWRDGFRSIHTMASIVTNDVICHDDQAIRERDTVATFMDGLKRDVMDSDERASASGVVGASRQQPKTIRRK